VAQTKHQIEALLAGAGTSPRRRFGQCFMIDGNLLRLVAEAGQVGPEDLVIEVGPGTGSLTAELLARARRVVAVEIDRDLAGILREQFAAEPKLCLIEGDALAGKHAINSTLGSEVAGEIAAGRRPKLVANLPYNIASPLVIELLIAGCGLLAFTVQREVAQRLRARAGAADYGPLSVMAQLLADVELLRVLPPKAFWPAPRIESALMRLTRREDAVTPDRAGPLGLFVHAIFSSRRKTLRNALGRAVPDVDAGVDVGTIIAAQGLAAEVRPEVLTPRQFLGLFEAVRAASGS
jgi:16S rRNA (adenine1518-N6/adenine1519-N6)-dimethyltransferase